MSEIQQITKEMTEMRKLIEQMTAEIKQQKSEIQKMSEQVTGIRAMLEQKNLNGTEYDLANAVMFGKTFNDNVSNASGGFFGQ